MIRRSILSLTLLVTNYSLLVTNCSAQSSNYIRVAIIQDAESLSLKAGGYYKITDSGRDKVLSRGRNLKTTVTAYKEGILIGGMNFNSDKIFIEINDPDLIIINGRKFRGGIQFIKNNNSTLSVVNYIDLEDYIKGISVREISHYWPVEALKAEAIVFRTFAVYKMRENSKKDYDLTDDAYSQVYGGRAAERYRINKAVDETKGIILTYQGKVFPAFYHATCAGHTEDASMLWNINLAPLKGVACGFCRESPHFSWHYVLTLKEIEEKLVNAGLKIGAIKDIAVLGKDKSGRITDLNIVSAKKGLKISAKDFRNIIGPNIIRSTNFSVNVIKNDAVFEGFGWGHGVGLCQWGAYFMAKQGYTAEQILKYYYPGTDVKTIGF